MAITTYTELQSAITNWLGGRSDIAAARVQEFIALFESVANRRLRVLKMQVDATLSTTDGFALLPTDYLSTLELVRVDSPAVPLELRSEVWLAATFASTTGSAQFYSIVDNGFFVRPSEDADFTLTYYQKIPAMASNATNWLLTSHPDVYLWGSLAEAHAFLGDDNNLSIAKSRRDEILDEVQRLDKRNQAGMAISSIGTTP